jgi:hypothetical protein
MREAVAVAVYLLWYWEKEKGFEKRKELCKEVVNPASKADNS